MTKRGRQDNGRSTIYRGKDGLWHGRVSMGLTEDGHVYRAHRTSKSRAKVVERVRELERARDRGEVVKVPERWSVEAWLTHWLENVSRPFVKQSTYEGFRAAVNVHLIPALGRVQLVSLKPEHLEKLYAAMLRKPTRRGTLMKPARVHQVHRTVRAALSEAVRRGHIVRNPAQLARTPTVDEYDVEPYTVEQIRSIFVAAQQRRNTARWVIARALGLRQGEALGLRWPDVDWTKKQAHVKRNRNRPRYRHGCGKPCGRKYAGHCPERVKDRADTDTAKSRAGKRTVPLPEAILELLREHASAQMVERERAAQLWVDEGYVFADELGQPINPRTDWDHWKQLLRDAGVPDGRLHDARHTAATMLLLLEVHERTIMSILGWSTTAMVSRYAHVVAPIHRDVAGRLDGLLWSSEGDSHSLDVT